MSKKQTGGDSRGSAEPRLLIAHEMTEGPLQLAAGKVSDGALAYAWFSVCSTAWDACLDAFGERLLKYSRWPNLLRALLHALYPAYFVYSGAAKLAGPDGPPKRRDARRCTLLLGIACLAAALIGSANGGKAKRAAQDKQS